MKSCGYLGEGGHYEIGRFFLEGGGGHLKIILGLFKGQDTEWDFLFGQQNFKYFRVCLIFLISFFFGGGGGGGGLNSRCWVQAYG